MPTLRTLIFLLLALMLPATNAAVQPQTFTSPYSQAELDRMLAPVALYPDSVLAQMLIAATYPLEVMEAAHWSREHPGLEGDAAVEAVENRDWDPGVKAMVAFPDVIERMDENINWTTHLGDAFLQQEEQVMATIQSLREHALEEGHLKSSDTVRIYREPRIIVIEPVRPQVVYVPYYDPWVVYGHWWHPHHPPYYWSRPHSYHRTSVFYWGSGINFSFGFYYSHIDWHHHHVVVNNYHHHDHYHNHRPGKPFYKYADYGKHYRHWRPEHRRQVHVDRQRIDDKRHQLGRHSYRQAADRGPDRHKAGRQGHDGHRSSRADAIRQQLQASRHGTDNRRNDAKRKPDRLAVGDRRLVQQRRLDNPRVQSHESTRTATERFRTNIERYQRQPEKPVNKMAAFQRDRQSTNERRFNEDRVRQLRHSLGNNRPATAGSGERTLKSRRDDSRAGAWSNRSQPSFGNHAVGGSRQARDNQGRRFDERGRHDMERGARQSQGLAGFNREQAAGRAMDSRRSVDRERAVSSRHSTERHHSMGREQRGNAGRGHDAAVAARDGGRR